MMINKINLKEILKKIFKGIISTFKELKAVNRLIKIIILIVSFILPAYIEVGINFYLKFIVFFVIFNLLFYCGYFIVGILSKPLKFIDNRLLGIHSGIYLAFYVVSTESSYSFFEEVNAVVIVVMVISYLTFFISKKSTSLFQKVCYIMPFSVVIIIQLLSFHYGEYYYTGDNEERINKIYSQYLKDNRDIYNVLDEKNILSDYKVIWYGNKNDIRKNYRNGKLKTELVTIGKFIEEPLGIDKIWRMVYWDTDFKTLPMNGHIYYPEKKGSYPLVVVIHGNHSMEEPSELGYEYIGEFLSKRGYVVAMVDENYFNGSWSGGYSDENDGRAYLTLKHIEQIFKWNKEEGNPIQGKIDEKSVALIGHSRGGETAFLSKLFTEISEEPEEYGVDFNFDIDIKSIIALGTTYGQYESCGDYPKIHDVNFLALQGSNDGDVSEFQGKKSYDNVLFTGDDFYFKSYLYIEGANHGQFNTMWGDEDDDFPLSLMINKSELISGKKQRDIALKYTYLFLESTLNGRTEFIPIFQNYMNGTNENENKRFINGYSDSEKYDIVSFEKNNFTYSISSESKVKKAVDDSFKIKKIRLRDDGKLNNKGIYISIDENTKNILSFNLMKNVEINKYNYLSFDMVSFGNEELTYNLKVQIIDNKGREFIYRVNQFYPLWDSIDSYIMKTKTLNDDIGKTEGTVFQTVLLPLDDTVKIDNISTIKFIFDKGEYILDNISLIK
ncbi:hypothetical protein [Oceanirhabdus sp. W0125-5]|uniref:hypothetical protein n=1 Tax=Oceanirhabdus sp. W0125-5 TaxID=2999116 RepID=UPI0022F2AB96|nr:hypothetical protein [Oceanirhabdus sp. W0125-5]WBW96146.1 hypothetical protein OW730_21005 [Oceanirhabdus sp. W0125-5]